MKDSPSSSASNPYAPPTVAEVGADPTLTWQVDGTCVLVKHGATLPQVDLDTGESECPMKAEKRIFENHSALMVGLTIISVAGYFGFEHVFNRGLTGFIVLLFLVVWIPSRLSALRGRGNTRVVVVTFIEESRAKRMALRRYFRMGMMILIAVLLLGIPVIIAGKTHDLVTWLLRLFGVGVPLLVALTIWALLDGTKTKVGPGPQGWLRIGRVHSDALAKLREIEREIHDKEISPHAARKRLVRTSWFHRYPLRLLIGRNWKRPLLVLNVVLMKLLRSKLLERESYHFSEAEEIPASKLCDALVKFHDDWLFAHPDWIFLSARHLPSPAGDIMVDSLFLASSGLEHCASVTHVWLAKNQGKGTTETRFFTWVEEDRVVVTIDHEPLPLSNPRMIGQRVSGTPGQVFEGHRNFCVGHAISASRDRAELLARIRVLMDESDALLTEAGYQSEVRETG